ncbi:MAG: LCP family protein [Hespellia sp.]|nr:LCP family protein [Hespellia sp.]
MWEEKQKTHRERKVKKKMRVWQKVILSVFLVLLVVVLGAGGSFFYLRAQGEKKLKTKVAAQKKETSSERKEEEGTYITYNNKKYRYKEDVINFLCLGIDKDIPIDEKRDTGSEGLSDTIVVASLDTDTNELKFISIPRDTIVPVKEMDTEGNFTKTENQQITLQYAYGQTAEDSCQLMADAVSNLLYKVPIQRYCSINFEALPVMNDAIGGVDVVALETVEWYAGAFYEGEQLHLEGQMALDYVRQRDESVFASSMGRIERQKQYIVSYIDKAKTVIKDNPTLPITVFQELQGNMCTNITVEDISYLVPELLTVSISGDNMCMIPGDVADAGEHEEYHVQTEPLKELVVNTFYEEVKAEAE